MITDGGSKAFGFNEKHDCSVVAFSYALEITYKEAYEKLEAAGRKKNSGFYVIEFLKHCGFNGYKHETISYKRGKGVTEQEFANTHQKGNWIVYTNEHVIAVIDGIIYDTRTKPAKGKVQYAWKFEKTS